MRNLALGLLLMSIVGLSWATAPVKSIAAEDSQWGSVSGQIVFSGEPFAAMPVEITQDKAHCVGDRGDRGPILNPQWVINQKNKGIKNVFVWLGPDSTTKNAKFAPEQIHPSMAKGGGEKVIDQPCCEFEPHVLAVQAGTKVLVKNSSPVAHNVQWNSKSNGSGNISLPSKSGVHTFTDLVADTLPMTINCNVHPWMNAYMRVFDHGYFAVTDADGKFEIKNAPKGKVRIFIWHEGAGYLGGREGRAGKVIEVTGTVTDLGKLELSKN
ncbi:cupredoxin domain-containing protein [Tuwongella immobilis]|uniref:Methylamine utilization protein n=1 Tax=Tuwongella immobilis TaxID=692036 RepID=A0A6C2YK21_9BACT|nr:hypothetical protein [Tuwongella immobilis]VIP01930.1 Uncharacterized protein OS=Planctomyces maris DSM 8797 GN=PM8797T_06762 PE=4 SV=1 [Tuwongella immobilis]VTR99878.1 Uncharacterized protein OS=Planctomyces maris DSM 8797 GN=PM8797T_06762 PE=4 SV=1 [Tuwongella immobilis]